jgi:hypothetical protein
MKRNLRCAVVVAAILGALFAASTVASQEHGDPFEDCGTIVQGVECWLFDSDNFGLYELTNFGGFNLGDRVLVRGVIDMYCGSFCMQGDACIADFTIEVCPDDIPTLSEWGMIIFCVLLFGWMAWMVVRRRKRATVSV